MRMARAELFCSFAKFLHDRKLPEPACEIAEATAASVWYVCSF
jgi:hypothetical protein